MATEVKGVWTWASGHGRDWLAGTVDMLDASVERTGMGWQRRRTKSGHLTRLTAFLKLPPPSEATESEIGGMKETRLISPLSSEKAMRSRTRGACTRAGGHAEGGPSNPQTSRTPSLGPGLARLAAELSELC